MYHHISFPATFLTDNWPADGVVVAIADSDPTKRAEIASQIGNPVQYDDYKDMLAKENCDIIVIAERWSKVFKLMNF